MPVSCNCGIRRIFIINFLFSSIAHFILEILGELNIGAFVVKVAQFNTMPQHTILLSR